MKHLTVDEIKAMMKMTIRVDFTKDENGQETIDFVFTTGSREIEISFDCDEDETKTIYVDESDSFTFNIEDFNLAQFSLSNDDRREIIKKLKNTLK